MSFRQLREAKVEEPAVTEKRARSMSACHHLISAAILTLLATVSPAQSVPRCTAASHYKVVPLPFHPAHISSSGVVAGVTEDHQPATWTEKDGLHEIELPAGFTAMEGLAINRAGDVVGTVRRDSSARPSAFKYSGGKLTLLSEDRSRASGITDSGEVAGENANQLVLWRQGKMMPLGGCCGGAAHGVNQHGEIVGQLNDKEGRYGAFLWDGRKLRTIGAPKGTMSSAIAINNVGEILVESFTPNAIFLWRNGKFTPIKVAADVANQPLALNNCTFIVGEFGAASDFYHAFVWDQSNGQRDLNLLIDPQSGWTLTSAVDVNDRGEIIGIGDHAHDEDAGFLLVPEHQGVNHEGH